MKNPPALTRRHLLALAAAGLAAPALPAGAQGAGAWRRVPEIAGLLDGVEPKEGGIALDLPFVSENGNSVPLSVAVEGTGVRALHIFAPANPSPQVATFHFTPLSPAAVETRIRLNESQTVVALALLDDGTALIAEREVRVTVSGCLTDAGTYASDSLFQTRVRVPETLAAGAAGPVLTMIGHPMETGLRPGPDGAPLPQRLIERFEASLDGEPVFAADLYRSVSADPYLKFQIAPQASGTLALTWREDTGHVTDAEARIVVG
ncbi:MAG: thiosulfate oxidation carrier complex protein SoxZ [Aquamicrobium sp.]|uniref:thiosulfate oxidation carrier protein SoxY n=1 Tax=Aquamicrobium sp. TaxID=1872579 RepID=UPI00349EED51|nr:thiosulfate oxidation carrier complex protein SoxZ [Aquamicrobium sp.]